MKNRDNIPQVKINSALKILLIPGLVIQWIHYMNPGKGFSGVAHSTRTSRSPLMTYVYSAVFWWGVCYVVYKWPDVLAALKTG
jgi:hypothetical protein